VVTAYDRIIQHGLDLVYVAVSRGISISSNLLV